MAELFVWPARGRVHKLTLFTHNFMDARQLEAQRVDACVFMAMTQDGPLSMCAYNAQRDHYLLAPLQTSQGTWQPRRPTWTPMCAMSPTHPCRLMSTGPSGWRT